jgi:HD-GYP domain-containing protein (c-di-GMP phosphodiesterase class II)
MDKMTHTKFNLNNFLLAISGSIDNVTEKNKNSIPYSSQIASFIALKIASFNDFTKENLSDILSYIILSKHNIEGDKLDKFPFIDIEIVKNELFQQILSLSQRVEMNIDIKNGFVVNKAFIIKNIEELEIDEVIKENFFYLAEMESFWLDLVSERLPFFILDILEDTTIEISFDGLLLIAKEISKIVYHYTNRIFRDELVTVLEKMCKVYNFDNKDTSRVLLSGYLCDIGLLKLPQDVFLKKERLNDLEYDIVKSAPYFTKQILSMIFGFDDIAKLASNYCERVDGSGYPYQVAGNELSLKDRLLAISYLYQALYEDRSYRKNYTKDEIFKILEEDAILGKLDVSIVQDLKAIVE